MPVGNMGERVFIGCFATLGNEGAALSRLHERWCWQMWLRMSSPKKALRLLLMFPRPRRPALR